MGDEVQQEEKRAGIKSALSGGVTTGFRRSASGATGAKKPRALLPSRGADAPLLHNPTTNPKRLMSGGDAGQGRSLLGFGAGFVVIADRLGGGLFRGSRFFRGYKFFGVEEWATQRGVVAGPGTVEAGFTFEVGAHGFHLGIEVVEIVEHERLREHGQLWRTEVVLAVMADDEVLDQSFEFFGEVGLERELGLQHF